MSTTPPQTITVHQSSFGPTWQDARKGDVWRLLVHGVQYPPELRSRPPRIRLLEHSKGHRGTRCELLDPFPGAPAVWPVGFGESSD